MPSKPSRPGPKRRVRRTRHPDPTSSETESSDGQPAGGIPRRGAGRSSIASTASPSSAFEFPARVSGAAVSVGNPAVDDAGQNVGRGSTTGSAGTSSFATRRAAMLRAKKTLDLEEAARKSLKEVTRKSKGAPAADAKAKAKARAKEGTKENEGSRASSSSSSSGGSGANSRSSGSTSNSSFTSRGTKGTKGGQQGADEGKKNIDDEDDEDIPLNLSPSTRGSRSQVSGASRHLPDWYLASSPLSEESGTEDKRNNLQVLCGFLIDAGILINRKIQHRAVPVACVVSGIITTIVLLVSLYYKEPSIKEGAFGHTTPVSLSQPIMAGTFEEALWSAVSGQDILSTASSSLGGGDYTWRRIVLTYKGLEEEERKTDTEVTTETYIQLDKVQELEGKLRALPTWISLCSTSVPATHRRLCDPGDSYISITFGSSVDVSDKGAAMGIVANITFDGLASYSELTTEELRDHLERVAGDSLLRWMPSGSDLNNIYALRTSFAFYLPEDVAESDWSTFITSEVEPVLAENEESDTMRVFYIVDGSDGLEEREFQRALRTQFPILLISPLATFFATVLVTQRFLLALSAFAVVLLAGAVDSVAAEIYDAIELPVMIFAAWGCNCVVVTDLACAAARAAEIWKFDSRLPHVVYDHDNPRHVIARSARKAVWFILEVFAPQMASAFMLLGTSFTVIPLLNEFAWHMGSGILLCCGFGAVLFPASVRLADLFARRGPKVVSTQITRSRTGSLRVEIAASCSYACYMIANTFLPVEVGAKAPWKRKIGQKLAIFSVRFLPNLGMRIWAAAVFVIAVMLVAFGQTWPDFTSDTPDLFVIGHRMRSWQAVRALFEPLPSASSILQSQLDDVYRCTVDAYDAAGCAAFICDSSSPTYGSGDSCACYHSQKSDTSTCSGVAARLFGTEETPSIAEWQYILTEVQERLESRGGSFYDVADAEDILARTVASDTRPPLSLEDWTSGSVYVQELSAGGIAAKSSSSVPLMEEACDRLICFCGAKVCEESFTILTDGSWDLVCPRTSSSDCRIDFPPSTTVTTTRTSTVTTRSATTSTTRMSTTTITTTTAAAVATDTEEDETVETGTAVDAVVVFGLDMPDEPTARTSGMQAVDFQSNFYLGDLQMQRNLLAFCEGTHPGLHIVERYCWPRDFKYWLREQNLMYPVPEEDFYTRLQQFLSEVDPYDMDNEYASAGHFWLDLDGRIGGFYAVFSAVIPEDVDSADYVDIWSYYLDRRNNFTGIANQSWLVLPLFVDEEVRDAVESGMLRVVWHFVVFSGVAALVLTWSCGLCCTVMLTLSVALAYLSTFSIWLGGRGTAGVLDVVMVASFLSMASTQLLRIVQQYALGQEGPLKKKDDFELSSMAGGQSQKKTESKHEFFWAGAIDSEIRVRAASALYRTSDTILGIFLASTIVAPIFLATTLEGLAQVLVAMMGACYASIPAVLAFCPVILALGLGPSRIYNRAVRVVWEVKRDERRSELENQKAEKASGRRRSIEIKKHTPKEQEAELAAQLLGWPFTTFFPDIYVKPKRRRDWCPCPWGKSAKRSDIAMDIDEEDAPQVLALDIHGATAMPPFHITMTVKERLGSDG